MVSGRLTVVAVIAIAIGLAIVESAGRNAAAAQRDVFVQGRGGALRPVPAQKGAVREQLTFQATIAEARAVVFDVLDLGDDRWIRLQARTFSPRPGIEQDAGDDQGVEAYLADLASRGVESVCEQAPSARCVHLLASYRDPLLQRDKDALRNTRDIYVLDPIPESAYFIGATPGASGGILIADDIKSRSRADWLGVIRPEYKLASSLCAYARSLEEKSLDAGLTADQRSMALCPNGGPPKVPQYSYRDRSSDPTRSSGQIVEVIVLFFADVDVGYQEVVLDRNGAGTSKWQTLPDGWRVLIPEGSLAQLAREDAVKWIQEGPPLPVDDNDDARGPDGVNADALPAGVDGAGITIAQVEGHTASPSHADFAGTGEAMRYSVADSHVPIWTRSTKFLNKSGDPSRYDWGDHIVVDINDDGWLSTEDLRLLPCALGTVCAILPSDPDLGEPLRHFHPTTRFLKDAIDGDSNHLIFTRADRVFRDVDAEMTAGNFSSVGALSDCDLLIPEAGSEEGICCSGACVGFCGSTPKQATPDPACGAPIVSFPTNPHYHATHVAGTLIGNGAKSADNDGGTNQWKGIAPKAELRGYRVKTTYDLKNNTSANGIKGDFQDALEHALIVSNSWGYSYQYAYTCAAYTPNTAFYDGVTSGYSNTGEPFGFDDGMLIVASAGNAGKAFDEPWGTVRVPNSGKNTLVVGNLRARNKVSEYSSHGPTNDGRLKPDVAVLGTSITSTYPGDTYREDSGTSMSTPVVAGSAALVAQKYADVCAAEGAPTRPSPAALRALLVHSAEDVHNTTTTGAVEKFGPDYATGYGRVQVDKAVDLVASAHFVYGQIDKKGDSDTTTFAISEAEAGSDIKVTLVWDDPPWTPNAAPNSKTGILQNDLDLLVEGPNGYVKRYFAPWVLDPADPNKAAERDSVGKNSEKIRRDHINTVEQVLVSAADVNPGTWKIRVSGFKLEHGPQPYVLVSEQIEGNCSRPQRNGP